MAGSLPASFVYLATAAGSAAQKAIANTATLGGRQEIVTVALNWYPVRGVRLQANWTRAMTLIAPADRAFLNGDHPSLFAGAGAGFLVRSEPPCGRSAGASPAGHMCDFGLPIASLLLKIRHDLVYFVGALLNRARET